MSGRQPPHDLDAERVVLGSMLLDPTARATAATLLVVEDFYSKTHGQVFGALLATLAEGKPVEFSTLAARLKAAGAAITTTAQLHELEAQGSSFSYSAPLHLVVECAARRRMLAAAFEATDAAYDMGVDFDVALGRWTDAPDRIRAPDVEPESAEEIVELVQGEESAWVVPGLLRRRERVILTGGEGAGKSEISRWIAMCVAAGRAPFGAGDIDAEPTLIVDLENEAGDIGDAARRIAGPLGYQGGCHARSRPQGIDLTQPRDVRWLTSLVAGERPALVVVGPLYKMYRGAEGRSKQSEEAAEIVSNVLDDLRVAYDCALWIEAHAPHGEGGNRDGGRPRGSALWMGWPNFGRYMVRKNDAPKVVELRAWRGDRHRRRSWPWGLREGGEARPWIPVWEKPGIAGIPEEPEPSREPEAALL